MVCDETDPSKESFQETQLQERPKTHPETGIGTPKPSQGFSRAPRQRGCGVPGEANHGIKAC